jgi:hypothetical protein
MRRGPIILATIAAAIAAFGAAPTASAATPKDVCDDLADGTLNGTYSAGDIAAYVAALGSDPAIQGYCTPFTPRAPEAPPAQPPATQPPAPEQPPGAAQQPPPGQPAEASGTPPTGNVLPAVSPTVTPSEGLSGATNGQEAPLSQTKATGTLPFTGTELTIFAIVGLALVAAGLMLRSTAKQQP